MSQHHTPAKTGSKKKSQTKAWFEAVKQIMETSPEYESLRSARQVKLWWAHAISADGRTGIAKVGRETLARRTYQDGSRGNDIKRAKRSMKKVIETTDARGGFNPVTGKGIPATVQMLGWPRGAHDESSGEARGAHVADQGGHMSRARGAHVETKGGILIAPQSPSPDASQHTTPDTRRGGGGSLSRSGVGGEDRLDRLVKTLQDVGMQKIGYSGLRRLVQDADRQFRPKRVDLAISLLDEWKTLSDLEQESDRDDNIVRKPAGPGLAKWVLANVETWIEQREPTRQQVLDRIVEMDPTGDGPDGLVDDDEVEQPVTRASAKQAAAKPKPKSTKPKITLKQVQAALRERDGRRTAIREIAQLESDARDSDVPRQLFRAALIGAGWDPVARLLSQASDEQMRVGARWSAAKLKKNLRAYVHVESDRPGFKYVKRDPKLIAARVHQDEEDHNVGIG